MTIQLLLLGGIGLFLVTYGIHRAFSFYKNCILDRDFCLGIMHNKLKSQAKYNIELENFHRNMMFKVIEAECQVDRLVDEVVSQFVIKEENESLA